LDDSKTSKSLRGVSGFRCPQKISSNGQQGPKLLKGAQLAEQHSKTSRWKKVFRRIKGLIKIVEDSSQRDERRQRSRVG
jgi:hypothetical protein